MVGVLCRQTIVLGTLIVCKSGNKEIKVFIKTLDQLNDEPIS